MPRFFIMALLPFLLASCSPNHDAHEPGGTAMEDRLANLEGEVVFADPALVPLDTLIKVTLQP
ncbi:MAG: hypothetical protein LJE91_03785 [Gammaproteobacteria bacterium]|jgi:hypothetical protein|nr:hypothetical protein [Gammaproteobacteria bacterium]